MRVAPSKRYGPAVSRAAESRVARAARARDSREPVAHFFSIFLISSYTSVMRARIRIISDLFSSL